MAPKISPGGRRSKEMKFKVNVNELASIVKYYNLSTCISLSQYLRDKTLGHEVQIRYRNASLDDFLAEMIPLKEELMRFVRLVEDAGRGWTQDEVVSLRHKIDQMIQTLIKYYNHVRQTEGKP